MRTLCLALCLPALAGFRGSAAEAPGAGGATPGRTEPAKPSLSSALARLKVPPDWFKSVEVRYDTGTPWKKARLHIRRLLAGGETQVQEAIKTTYLYARKGDIGDGHELPLYLFLGGEYAWALAQYEKRLSPRPEGHTHEYLSLASCYAHFAEYERALAALDLALKRLPKPPWRIAREADVHSHLGDLFAEMGNAGKAKRHYEKAIKLYPTSTQPWGRHLLKKHAARVRAKLDLMAFRTLDLGKLPDGTYTGSSLGYKGDVKVSVALRGGRIVDIEVEHSEDIDQNATKIVPQRIIESQGLEVDAVTGATLTSNAVVAATFQALQKAGLEK